MHSTVSAVQRDCEDLPKVRLLSFIVPTMTDEESILEGIYEGVREQAEKVAEDWEILFIDHGHEEATGRGIETLRAKDPTHVRLFCVECEGRAEALALGYGRARGDFVFTLESDQDNDLAEIEPFMNRISGHAISPPSGMIRDRWQNILPRGVLQRVRPSRTFKSTLARSSMLPV